MFYLEENGSKIISHLLEAGFSSSLLGRSRFETVAPDLCAWLASVEYIRIKIIYQRLGEILS